MSSVCTLLATTTFSQMIYVSGELTWPMTWGEYNSYASNFFTIDTVFEIFRRVALLFFFRYWIAFH